MSLLREISENPEKAASEMHEFGQMDDRVEFKKDFSGIFNYFKKVVKCVI